MAVQAIWRRLYLVDPWRELYDARNTHSDEQLQTLLQSTALYTVLAHLRHGLDMAVDQVPLVLHPAQAGMSFELDDLRSRMSDKTDQEVGLLLEDARHEASLVDEAVESAGLAQFYDEARRLLLSDGVQML